MFRNNFGVISVCIGIIYNWENLRAHKDKKVVTEKNKLRQFQLFVEQKVITA
jgi:hypothetical protein